MKRCLLLTVLVMAMLFSALPVLAADGSVAPGDSAVYFKGASPFADQDTIDNQLAVAVLVKLGIIDGYRQDDGTYRFAPARIVTRAEMAKIVSLIATGGQDVAAYQDITAADFRDVPETYWARQYVEYGASFGIISGRGDGYFYPEQPVSTSEALKMLLVVLGWDFEINGLVGKDWQANTLALAETAGLLTADDKVDATASGCDRDTVALLTYRALFAREITSLTSSFFSGKVTLLGAKFGAERYSQISAYMAELLTRPEAEKVVQLKDLPIRTELTAFIDAPSVYSTKGGYSCDAYDQDGNKLQRFIFEKQPEKSQVVVYKILSGGSISLFGKDKAADYQPCPEPYQVIDAVDGPERYTVEEIGGSGTETLIVRAEVPIYKVADGELEEQDELEDDDLFYMMRNDGGKLLAIFVVGKGR